MFLPDRFVKGTCPRCAHAGPVRRQLRELRRHLLALRPDRPGLGRLRHAPGRARVRAHLLPPRELRGDAAQVDPLGRAAGRGRQQARRVVRGGAARLGRLARRAVLRLRDPRRAGQVLLRLARRAGRLHGQLRATTARRAGLDFDAWWAPDSDGRAAPLHRQGHPVLPLAVLAGDARGRGLQDADGRARPRLPDGQRREDVEVARHLRHRARATSTTCRPTTSATSSRPSSGPASTTST